MMPLRNWQDAAPAELVLRSERILFATLVVVSIALEVVLIASLASGTPAAAVVLLYAVLIAAVMWLLHAFSLGYLRGNGVLVTQEQFPLVHDQIQTHAQRLGLARTPTVYIVQAGGLLNAFATRFVGRDFIVLYSDVVALAVTRGEAALGFIVAHELGHHWRGHLRYRWLIAPARLVPYLGSAYSRACEYTCDRLGAFCQPDGAAAGLLVLAAGPQLHSQVNATAFAAQAEEDRGFWIRWAELIASHPRLPKRLAALRALGIIAVAGRTSNSTAAA